MTEPTNDKLDRLPKWVKDHICDLQRQRKEAITALNEFRDAQTASPISYSETLCIGDRPTEYARFIQSDRVEFALGKEQIAIRVDGNTLRISSNTGSLKIQPESSNVVKLWSTNRYE